MRTRHSVLRWLYAALASLRSLLGRVLRRLEQELMEPPPVVFEPGEDPATPHRPQGPPSRPPEHWLRTVRERAPYLLRDDAGGTGLDPQQRTSVRDEAAGWPPPPTAPSAQRRTDGAEPPGATPGDTTRPARPWGDDLYRRRHFRPVPAPGTAQPSDPSRQGEAPPPDSADGPSDAGAPADHAGTHVQDAQSNRPWHVDHLDAPEAPVDAQRMATDATSASSEPHPDAADATPRGTGAYRRLEPLQDATSGPNDEEAAAEHEVHSDARTAIPWDATVWAMDDADSLARPDHGWLDAPAGGRRVQPEPYAHAIVHPMADPWPPLPPSAPAVEATEPVVRRTWDPRARQQRVAREQEGRTWNG